MNKIDIGKNIREIRIARGMTQCELANRIADVTGEVYTDKAVSAWEHGTRRPPPEVIAGLCFALDCSLYSLYYPDIDGTDDLRRIQDEVASLSRRHHESLQFLVFEWLGNLPPLIEADRAYALLPPSRRISIVEHLIAEVTAADQAGELRTDLPVNIDVILSGLDRLRKLET